MLTLEWETQGKQNQPLTKYLIILFPIKKAVTMSINFLNPPFADNQPAIHDPKFAQQHPH